MSELVKRFSTRRQKRTFRKEPPNGPESPVEPPLPRPLVKVDSDTGSLTPFTDSVFGTNEGNVPTRRNFQQEELNPKASLPRRTTSHSNGDDDGSTVTGHRHTTSTGERHPFNYDGYKLEPGCIRIFQYTVEDDGIEGSFRTERLKPYQHGARFKYGAISFEWGDINKRGEARVGGSHLSIPQPLEDGLKQVWHSYQNLKTNTKWDADEPISVWADAICINQADEDEKKSQIQMMGTIYEHADPLYIWLGFPTHWSDRVAMDTVKELAAPFPKSRNSRLADHPSPDYSNAKHTSRKWTAIESLLWRSYFSRSWVIQEIVQPSTQDIRVFCGRRSVQWDEIRIAVHLLRTHSWPQDPTASWLRALEVPIDKTRDKWQKLQTDFGNNLNLDCSLAENLFTFRARKCRFPEDKIWSIRSICTDLKSDELVPEVGKDVSVGQIYLSATSIALQRSDNLDILSLCRQYNTEVYRSRSWIPDYWSYAQYQRCRPLASQRNRYTGIGYTATGKSKPEVHISSDHTLGVRGVVIASVAELATLPEIVGPCPANAIELLKWTTFYCRCYDLVENFDYNFIEDSNSEPRKSDPRQKLWRFMVLHFPQSALSGAEEDNVTRSSELHDFCNAFVANPFAQNAAKEQVWRDLVSWQKIQTRRSLGLTDNGLLVQLPLDAKVGDEITLIQGARVPFVRHGSGKMIGECRVNGYMDGEMWPKYAADGRISWLQFR